MKKRFCGVLVLVFLLGGLAAAQAMPANAKRCSVPATNTAIARISEQWKQAYNAGDPESVAALYAEDATYLTQHFSTGVVHGRNAIKAYVKKGTDAKYKVDAIDLLTSDCSGDFAYVITRYKATNGSQKATGFNLVVLKRTKGIWLIVAHEAAVPDEANSIKTLDIADSH